MDKGEARVLKWRDVNYYKNDIGTWVTLNVRGKTGSRLALSNATEVALIHLNLTR